MYDLSGAEAMGAGGRGGTARIKAFLARPDAERTVATVVHEATHQIAYNSGLCARLADVPMWVSEGLAMYFEPPDLANAKGWRSIGAINRPRLEQLHDYLDRRPAYSLRTLLVDDRRFRDTRTSLDAYAEAWALNHYLLKQRPAQYVAYLKAIGEKQPLVWDEPSERHKQFQSFLGDPGKIDAELLRYVRRLR
jgi:hypothetical protein